MIFTLLTSQQLYTWTYSTTLSGIVLFLNLPRSGDYCLTADEFMLTDTAEVKYSTYFEIHTAHSQSEARRRI